MFESISIVFGLAALLSIINYKWLKLPYTIGLMILSILLIGVLNLLSPIFPSLIGDFCTLIFNVDFEDLLFNGLLGFLLFAGALHINIKELASERKAVFIFASLGVILSTVIVGGGVKLASTFLGLDIPLIYCLLFGALISPTDPIAVLSILKDAKVGKSLQLKIEGESLFNDGVGVVVFSGLLLLVPAMERMEQPDGNIVSEISHLFAVEVVGGLVFGAFLGFLGYYLIKAVFEEPKLVVVLSLAVVMSGSAIAHLIHVSSPLAMVVAGLIIGNKLDVNHEMNSESKHLLNEIWEVLDEVLNGILFVMIGLVFHILEYDNKYFILGVICIFIVLLARFISIFMTYSLINKEDDHPLNTIKILTWGGLRGGISIALALSLRNSDYGDGIILMTYIVVFFSIIVQGLTIGRLVKSLMVTKT